MDELTARLIWQRAPGLTAARFLHLLHLFGTAGDALAAGPTGWQQAELPPRTGEFLCAKQGDTSLSERWLAGEQQHLLMADHPHFPRLLRDTPDGPAGLFVKGRTAVLTLPQLALVGSRNPTVYGREAAQAFAGELSRCGLSIVSGLAMGIDAASHAGALQVGGITVAVCGTGLDTVYPRSSEALARDIAQQGALISEFTPGTPPRKHHFPQRNRLISGMSLGVLVVEAALHSGSLITARLAGEQGREVFALPGSIHSPLSKGCHQLIRQGAKLVDCTADILSELGPLASGFLSSALADQENPLDFPAVPEERLDKTAEILLDALGYEPTSIDQLVLRTGLTADSVSATLLTLELSGNVSLLPGGRYLRTPY